MDKGSRGQVDYSPWGHKRVGHDLVIKQENGDRNWKVIAWGWKERKKMEKDRGIFQGWWECFTSYLGWHRCIHGKESACNAWDPGSTPRWGRSPGERNGYPLQYACRENPMNRGAWQATVHGVTKSRTRQVHTIFKTYQNKLLRSVYFILCKLYFNLKK